MRLPKWLGFIAKRLPDKWKAKLFDVAIDKMTKDDKKPEPPADSKFLDRGPSSRRKP